MDYGCVFNKNEAISSGPQPMAVDQLSHVHTVNVDFNSDFIVAHDEMIDLLVWCEENCTDGWSLNFPIFAFESKIEATLFKLVIA